MLPDLLANSLKAFIVGTAVGTQSASVGYYYANPGNRFWRVLNEIGITKSRIAPSNYSDLLNYRVGLTDLVKTMAGMDSTIKQEAFDIEGLKSKIRKYAPAYVCFNGKKAGKVFMGVRDVSYGLQVPKIGNTELFVAHSTSGANNGNWKIQSWKEFSRLIEGV